MTDQTADRLFDVRRWSDHPEVNRCLTDLVEEIETQEGRVRKRVKAAPAFRAAVSALVLDLYVAWKANPEMHISVPLSSRDFADGKRYARLHFTYDTFKPAFDGLRKLGYFNITRGGFIDRETGIGRVTRIIATKKLIDKLRSVPLVSINRDPGPEIIILKNEKKMAVAYEATAFTRQAEANLKSINHLLSQHWYDLDLTDDQFEELTLRMCIGHLEARQRKDNDVKPAGVDFSARSLHRIFNNGDWDQGGRFYGGWWQSIPSEYRRYITIDHKPTIEVDYSGMHPVMLYAEANAPMPGDPYDPAFVGAPNASRALVKLTFNKLLNASGRIVPEDFDEATVGMSWKKFQDCIVNAHAPIRHRFKSGDGLRLQKKDAAIAEQVMLRFLGMGYACLPVHDSFVVHYALQDELERIMQSEFEKVLGIRCPVKLGERAPGPIRTGLVNDDIMEAIMSGNCSGFEMRWLEWRSMQDGRSAPTNRMSG